MKKRPATPSPLSRYLGVRLQRQHHHTKFRWLTSRTIAAAVALVLIAAGGIIDISVHRSAAHVTVTQLKVKPASHFKKPAPKADEEVAPPAPAPAPVPPPQPVQPVYPASDCHDNTLSQLVIISISQRHMWACQLTTLVYDSPVITGMSFLAADLTPTGTYHVYGKYTNQTLKGCDSTGCWDDPVSYWMPWLSNQYGVYGFHDATWRPDSDFGAISPDSPEASHGCIELPLSTATWFYNWAPVGQTLTIEA